jgi:microcystin-dependent protein
MGVQQHWSLTPANNQTADAGINFRENQAPSTVNDAARQLMARVKATQMDQSGDLLTGGTATAYTLTTNEVFTALVAGISLLFRAHATNTGAATLSIDGLTAKPLQSLPGIALRPGEIIQSKVYRVSYVAGTDVFRLLSAPNRFVGEVFDFAGTTAPPLCLFCFGQAVSRTTYAALFAEIGVAHGIGDGSTTFNLPDMRGRVVAGKDDMGGASANRLTGQPGGLNGDILGAAGGSETHALAQAELAAHTHAAGSLAADSGGAHQHHVANNDSDTSSLEASETLVSTRPAGDNGSYVLSGTSTAADRGLTSSSGAHPHTVSGTSGSTGSGTAHNNLPPTLILNKCIFAGA